MAQQLETVNPVHERSAEGAPPLASRKMKHHQADADSRRRMYSLLVASLPKHTLAARQTVSSRRLRHLQMCCCTKTRTTSSLRATTRKTRRLLLRRRSVWAMLIASRKSNLAMRKNSSPSSHGFNVKPLRKAQRATRCYGPSMQCSVPPTTDLSVAGCVLVGRSARGGRRRASDGS